ncbi:MAG: calcium-translocating P-type ATPase, PMCA-type, partial [Synergistetes bacterium]|nr:calcium-translocating P-type ATPase, PMCA-type [Synergistota bacterium]MDW8193179.1 calcium-translocating P-type ATPase, PMCA-type [Synergistota bacterium]
MKKQADFYKLPIEEVFSLLESDMNSGLSEEEAQRRLSILGPNKLKEEKRKGPFKIFLSQFKNPMSYLLGVAALISFAVKEVLDALAILVVLLVNATIGLFMEYKAERALEKLKKMVSINALVLRDGALKKIHAEGLVPGDVVVLEAGDIVPADIRIFKAEDLEVDESVLTGESTPVSKVSHKLDEDLPIYDRVNLLFAGTHVVRGRGWGVVYATGMDTEFGKISKALQSVESPKTPMEKRLEVFSSFMLKLVILVGVVVFLLGLIKGYSILNMLETSIALAVAAVPEGLPVVVTITLAIGVHKMAKKNALVRNLASVETLGSSTVICTDKTGTLTQNKMKVAFEFFKDDLLKQKALKVAVLCNNAFKSKEGYIGDPMEVALLEWAEENGIDILKLRERFPRVKEIPFDSKLMKMTTIHEGFLAVKGAPERLLSDCKYTYDDKQVTDLTEDFKRRVVSTVEDVASKAMRTLAFAIGESEDKLIFLGFVGIKDPLRPEAKEAVKKCKEAGIDVIMLTGDHLLTAATIAKEAGIVESENPHPLSSSKIESLPDDALYEAIMQARVGARILPEHKLRVVEVLQNKGHVVAMTGDGVNDIIALKKADIGIAMGIAGTEVTKEASDIILQDDRFATIVDAVEAGRVIFDNIRKVIYYLLSCNISEIFTVLLGVLWEKGLLLAPLQILWINLVTDVLPALGISFDPPEENVMKRPPRSLKESFLTKKHYFNISSYGALFAIFSIGLAVSSLNIKSINIDIARSYMFHCLVFCQILHSFNLREKRFIRNLKELFINKTLVIGVAISFFLQISATYIPLLQKVLQINPLSLSEWLMILTVATASIISGNIIEK